MRKLKSALTLHVTRTLKHRATTARDFDFVAHRAHVRPHLATDVESVLARECNDVTSATADRHSGQRVKEARSLPSNGFHSFFSPSFPRRRGRRPYRISGIFKSSLVRTRLFIPSFQRDEGTTVRASCGSSFVRMD